MKRDIISVVYNRTRMTLQEIRSRSPLALYYTSCPSTAGSWYTLQVLETLRRIDDPPQDTAAPTSLETAAFAADTTANEAEK